MVQNLYTFWKIAMTYEIKKQIDFLEYEIARVKEYINDARLDCSTSVYVIVKRYRDEMKSYLQVLRMNLDDDDYND